MKIKLGYTFICSVVLVIVILNIFSNELVSNGTEFTLIAKGLIIAGLFCVFGFWVISLVDFFQNTEISNRVAWGFGLFFFSWLGALIYFFKVIVPRKQE